MNRITQPFTYRIDEGGTLYFSGEMPAFAAPDLTPWYSRRAEITRLVAEGEATVSAFAFHGFPSLILADLLPVVSVGGHALEDCPRLTAVVLGSGLTAFSPTALAGTTSLLSLDFADTAARANALGLTLLRALYLRCLPTAEGEVLAEGEVGGGHYRLTEDGTLAFTGAALPDYRHPQDAPWFPYRERITRLSFDGGVTKIGERAVSSLDRVTSVTVAGRCTLADGALAGLSCLTELTLFSSVQAMGAYALSGIGVRLLLLPAGLTTLPIGLLENTRSLRVVVLPPLLTAAEGRILHGVRGCRLVAAYPDDAARALSAGGERRKPAAPLCAEKKVAAALAAAEGTAKKREACLAAAEEKKQEVLALCEELRTLLDTAKNTYLTAETRRLGFGEEAPKEKKGRRARRALRGYRETVKREGEEEKQAHAAAGRQLRLLRRALSDYRKAVVPIAAAEKKALSAATAALRHAERAFPYLSDERAAAEALLTIERAPLYIPIVHQAAARELALFARYLPTHRYDAVKDGIDRLLHALFAIPLPENDEGTLPVPHILVAGGKEDDSAALAVANALRAKGAVVTLAGAGERSDDGYDALVLCDGEETDPNRYDERRASIWEQELPPAEPNERRQSRDLALLSAFFLYAKPILAIGQACGFVNASFGGKQTRRFSEATRKKHEKTIHDVVVLPSSFLYKIYEPTVRPLRVVSRHEGGIATLGRGLSAVSRAEGGVIEAFAHAAVPLFGVQFLPEAAPSTEAEARPFPYNGYFAAQKTVTAADSGAPLFAFFVTEAAKRKKNPAAKLAAKRHSNSQAALSLGN